jgi:hypothetical protein
VKAFAKIAWIATIVLVLLLAVPIAYSTAHGYTTWWIRSGGSVRVDGVANGYLHKNWSGTAVIITRTDLKPSQSYRVVFSTSKTSKSLIYCGDWQVPRFFVFPIGDVNPPCSGFLDDSELQRADLPQSSTASIRPGLIEFSTERGKYVTASW